MSGRPDTLTLATSLKHRITVFAGDSIGRHIKKYGLHEKESLLLLNALLRKLHKPVALDVGANIGNHALAFSLAAQKVHAFEPAPAMFALLEQNIQQNALKNIEAHPLALSDREGETFIHLAGEDNLGRSSLEPRGSSAAPIPVRRQRGDAFLQERGIAQIDFIKIDAEGHEYFVVKGLMKAIRRHRPVISMEWNDPLTRERFAHSEEFAFLRDEYRIFALGINYDKAYWRQRPLASFRRKLTRLLAPRKAVIHAFDPAESYDNLLLLPKGREDLLRGLPAIQSPSLD